MAGFLDSSKSLPWGVSRSPDVVNQNPPCNHCRSVNALVLPRGAFSLCLSVLVRGEPSRDNPYLCSKSAAPKRRHHESNSRLFCSPAIISNFESGWRIFVTRIPAPAGVVCGRSRADPGSSISRGQTRSQRGLAVFWHDVHNAYTHRNPLVSEMSDTPGHRYLDRYQCSEGGLDSNDHTSHLFTPFSHIRTRGTRTERVRTGIFSLMGWERSEL